MVAPIEAARTAPAPWRGLATRLARIDRVVLATAALLAVLAVVVPGQAGESVRFTIGSLASIAPFLLLSVAVAAYTKATGLDRQVAAVFGGHPARTITLAAVFGALSPFCSCGVVPIIAGLLAAGVPVAPVMAFWLASPLMDPEMFILLAAVFPLPFVLAKALAAFAMGLGGGFVTHAFATRPAFAAPLRAGVSCCASSCAGPATGSAPVAWRFWREPARRALFGREAWTTTAFLGKWLTLAFLIESLMVAYVPADAVAGWLGGGAWWAIPAAAIVGVPAYLNGYAAIPLVNGLMGMGMAPGAGLTFMLAGGVTSIPAAMAVFALVKRPVFALYLALGLTGSVLAGLLYGLALA